MSKIYLQNDQISQKYRITDNKRIIPDTSGENQTDTGAKYVKKHKTPTNRLLFAVPLCREIKKRAEI
jgi:hypothetical protein